MISNSALGRRELLKLASGVPLAFPAAAQSRRKTVAAIVTEYRHWSHADVIVGRLLGGNSANGTHSEPRTRVVSLYTDQVPQNTDMSRDLAARHGFRIFPTIADALTLGNERLSVDAVVFIGEHGTYPTNGLGQKLYPRHELFSKILDEFERSSRSVPVFFDKHLSYSWEKAKNIYDRSRKLGFPFMAGSSIPVTPRTPPLDIPLNTRLENAVIVGYGDVDAYGFHTLEALQCMVERRAGGETGIRSVEIVEGDAVWKWRDSPDGAWSKPLLAAALDRIEGRGSGDLAQVKQPVLFKLQYRDGLRAAAYMLNGAVSTWLFAARAQGRPELLATHFGPAKQTRPLPHFDGLVRCIEEMFVTGKQPWPVERTLLTTGALAFLFESRRSRGPVETPDLAIAYTPPAEVYVQRS